MLVYCHLGWRYRSREGAGTHTFARVQERGKDIFRSKGTLCIHGQKRMFNFQGVHETFQFAASKLLTEADANNPHSEIVFIGRDLDKDAIKQVCFQPACAAAQPVLQFHSALQ